jgi:hypothetical protein
MTSEMPSAHALAGRSFDCVFDAFTPRITFQTSNRLRVQARLGHLDIDQALSTAVAEARPSVFMISWTENDGNFVAQVHDHEQGVVHNRTRLAGGNVFRTVGALRPVAA